MCKSISSRFHQFCFLILIFLHLHLRLNPCILVKDHSLFGIVVVLNSLEVFRKLLTIFLKYGHGHCVTQRYNLYKLAFHKACSNIQAFSLCDQGRTDYPTYPRSLKSVTLFHDFRFCAPGCMSHKNEQNMSYSEILLRLIYNFCNLYWADQVKVLLPCFVSIFMKIYQQKIFTQCASENNQNFFLK